VGYANPRVAADGRTLWMEARPEQADEITLASVDLDVRELVPRPAAGGDLRDVVVSADGREALLRVNEAWYRARLGGGEEPAHVPELDPFFGRVTGGGFSVIDRT
jgi:hypothetical protein